MLAADSLLRLIRGEVESIDPMPVRGELIVRQSCGAHNGQWSYEPERASFTRHYLKAPRPKAQWQANSLTSES